MKKRLLTFMAAILIVYLTVGRGISIKHEIGKVLRLDLFWGDMEIHFDNHDHVWHNDGATVAVIHFSREHAETMRQQLEHSSVWNSNPMPEEFRLLAYERCHTWAKPSSFREMAQVPLIEDGYWFLVNQDDFQHGILLYGQDAVDTLVWESSWNAWHDPGGYALALYDRETDTLYYFQRNL